MSDMRAEFQAWVQDCGCDTDGAWSAWQGCWNRRAALPVAPLTDEHAAAIHRMPYVRSCLLQYANRPVDETAADAVKAIAAQVHALLEPGAQPLPVAADRLIEQALERIEQTLTIPAAEYVPAIGDVFLIIDETRAALRTRLLRHSEGKE